MIQFIIDEDLILNRTRNQYDANNIIKELRKIYPRDKLSNQSVITITDKSIYSDNTYFVFVNTRIRDWRFIFIYV